MTDTHAVDIPEQPSAVGLEAKLVARWEGEQTYRFDRSRGRHEIFAIDTPPPTVSGSLHVGSVFSYTHTDIVARFQRMRGKEPFYPMGWDDNGLPTERRVQNYFGVRCDPSVPFDPDFRPPRHGTGESGEPIPVSRPNFIALCEQLTREDERAFEALWRHLGLSVDWAMTYTTIGQRAREVSQRDFLALVERGHAYREVAPTLWDIDYRTAIAQAELEDRQIRGAHHRIRFRLSDESEFAVETSRPELLPACVALVAHPDDDRYRVHFGSTAITPLFAARVPVLPHELAEPDRGTGLAMVCTFGDLTDVVWWRDLSLPLKPVIRVDGTIAAPRWGEPGWETLDVARASVAHAELTGLSVPAARRRIAVMLEASGDLLAPPQPVQQAVKFYEKGERPLEIIPTAQWFVRTLVFREELLERGRQITWHPAFMRSRYEAWVEGLNQDWCISRQRYFGVPFPVWYPLGPDGEPDYAKPILAFDTQLPVDPSTDLPAGYDPEQRGMPGGFTADPDVMDTWSTSALTPQIAGGWGADDDLYARVFPMDLRPQSHDIIRTWLFYTVLRSHLTHGTVPWTNAAISGFVVDPDRKKMSKSKGNVVTPMDLIDRFGADAVRYWAARARLGTDTAFDESQMTVGRRLSTKILNASRFVLSLSATQGDITDPLDRSMLAALGATADRATTALAGYEHARAIEIVESFFWMYCDDYLELVKDRAYGSRGEAPAGSAATALHESLAIILRLFAPFLPFVTEEVWSWWRSGSIHRARWPADELRRTSNDGHPLVLEVAVAVLGEIRRAKAAANVSLRTPVRILTVSDAADRLAALASAESDVRAAGKIAAMQFRRSDASLHIELITDASALPDDA
jgi:valyl-tRNA synthetase